MRKTIFLLLSFWLVVACGQTTEQINIGKLPSWDYESGEEPEIEYSYGTYFGLKGKEGSVLYISEGKAYMVINGKTEELADVTNYDNFEGDGLDWEKENVEQKMTQTWSLANENYEVLVNEMIGIISEETGLPDLKAKLTITDLKTNASKVVDIQGYFAD